MKQAKFAKAFDHRTTGKIIAYPGGYEGELNDATYKAAKDAGALVTPKPKGKPDNGE